MSLLGHEGGALKTHGVVAQAAGQEEPQRHRKWGGRGALLEQSGGPRRPPCGVWAFAGMRTPRGI